MLMRQLPLDHVERGMEGLREHKIIRVRFLHHARRDEAEVERELYFTPFVVLLQVHDKLLVIRHYSLELRQEVHDELANIMLLSSFEFIDSDELHFVHVHHDPRGLLCFAGEGT